MSLSIAHNKDQEKTAHGEGPFVLLQHASSTLASSTTQKAPLIAVLFAWWNEKGESRTIAAEGGVARAQRAPNYMMMTFGASEASALSRSDSQNVSLASSTIIVELT